MCPSAGHVHHLHIWLRSASLQEDGVEPNVVTYNTVLEAYAHLRLYEQALAVLDQLESKVWYGAVESNVASIVLALQDTCYHVHWCASCVSSVSYDSR